MAKRRRSYGETTSYKEIMDIWSGNALQQTLTPPIRSSLAGPEGKEAHSRETHEILERQTTDSRETGIKQILERETWTQTKESYL